MFRLNNFFLQANKRYRNSYTEINSRCENFNLFLNKKLTIKQNQQYTHVPCCHCWTANKPLVHVLTGPVPKQWEQMNPTLLGLGAYVFPGGGDCGTCLGIYLHDFSVKLKGISHLPTIFHILLHIYNGVRFIFSALWYWLEFIDGRNFYLVHY